MFPVDDLLVAVNRLVRAALSDDMAAGRLVIEFDPARAHVEVSWQASASQLEEMSGTACDRL